MGDLEGNEGQLDEHMESFYRLVEDAGKELYLGCSNFSKLYYFTHMEPHSPLEMLVGDASRGHMID